MNKIRLCIAYPNKSSYSETFIQNHIKNLNPVSEIYGGWFPYLNENNKKILKFPLNYMPLRGVIKRSNTKLFLTKYSKQLAKYLIVNNINVVFAEYGITAFNILEACKISKLPLITHFHGFDAFEYETINKFKDGYKKLFQYSSSIISVSKPMTEQLTLLGANKSKIIYNPYGINTIKFLKISPKDNQPNFVAVGRFTAKKGQKYTLEAFKLAYDKYNQIKLFFIGDGEDLKQIKDLVKKYKMQDCVKFLGRLNHTEIIKVLSKSRGFLQHSIKPKTGDMEGTPNTILEASSMGLPVISTYHSGIPEAVLHNKTGYLVEEKDVEKMSKYIIDLINNPLLAEKLGITGRAHILANYNLENRISNLKDIINKVLS